MTQGQAFLQELMLEAEVTRRFLERVPFDQAAYRPSEKSESLGRLAIHIAETLAWWSSCVRDSRLDFANFQPKDINQTEELLSYFDELLAHAKADLETVKDEELNKEWSMTYGDQVLFSMPKRQVMRIFCLNHWIHHRAQLGVYLRLLDIPVPATYGPSADDEHVTLIQGF